MIKKFFLSLALLLCLFSPVRADYDDGKRFTAWDVSTDTTNFDGNLSSTDTDVQTALETLDELILGIADHASLTNLAWALSGHNDTTFNVNQNADGRIGIGTTAPAALIQGVGGAGSIYLSNQLGNNTNKSNAFALPHYISSEEAVSGLIQTTINANNNVAIGGGHASLNAATAVQLYTAANATTLAGSPRLTVTSTGDIGINTTGPASKLQVIGTARIGDAANYSNFEADGTLHFEGNATVWKKMVCEGYRWKNDDGVPPAWNNSGFATGNAGYYSFTEGGDCAVHAIFELPTDYKQGTDLLFFVNFTNVEDGRENEVVAWTFEPSWARTGRLFVPEHALTTTFTFTRDAVKWIDHYTELTPYRWNEEFNGTIDSKINVRLYLNSHETTARGAMALLSFGFWYEVDTVGARSLGSK